MFNFVINSELDLTASTIDAIRCIKFYVIHIKKVI
jgi:hypothetical protein